MKKFFASFFWGSPLVFLLMLVSSGSGGELTNEQKVERINELYKKYKRSFPDVPDLGVAELIVMRKEEDVLLVDRREVKEHGVSMLPGAMTSGEFEENIEKYQG